MTRTDDPQPLGNGLRTPEAFYHALGYALVAFTEIDGSLFALFCALTIDQVLDIGMARRTYYESWDFGVRLRVVEKAVAAKGAGQKTTALTWCGQWEAIRAGIETLKDQRNQLAHSSAAASFEFDEALGPALIPALRLPSDKFSQAAERLDTRRLLALAVEFENMADRIHDFCAAIAPGSDGRYSRSGIAAVPGRRRQRP
jgi:hypothetical protein